MNFSFWKKRNIEERGEKEDRARDTTLEMLLDGGSVEKNMALAIPSIAGAINKISGTVAGLPIRLYRRENGKPVEVEDDRRVYLLNVDSGDTLNSVNFISALIEDYYLGKGGFLYIDRAGGVVRSLRYVDEAKIFIAENFDPIFKDFDIYVSGKKYFPFDFVKILRKTKNGGSSRSIVEENSKIISTMYDSLTFESNSVKKGGNKRGFFKSAKKLAGPAIEELKRAVQSLYSGAEGAERNLVLNDGIDFKETSATSVEMQLDESKKTNADEIFKIFGFPKSIVQGGASAEDKSLFTATVVALLNTIEAAFDKDLLLESEKADHFFAFDTRDLTRGDMRERFEAYQIALDKHFMQIDEVRELEDMKPMGFNFVTLGLADVLVDPKTKAVYVPNTGQSGRLDELKGGVKSES